MCPQCLGSADPHIYDPCRPIDANPRARIITDAVGHLEYRGDLPFPVRLLKDPHLVVTPGRAVGADVERPELIEGGPRHIVADVDAPVLPPDL